MATKSKKDSDSLVKKSSALKFILSGLVLLAATPFAASGLFHGFRMVCEKISPSTCGLQVDVLLAIFSNIMIFVCLIGGITLLGNGLSKYPFSTKGTKMPKNSKKTSKQKTDQAPAKNTVMVFIVGLIIILTTPFVQPILNSILTKDCPTLYGRAECGLVVGVRNAAYLDVVPVVWLVIGVLVLGYAVFRHLNTQK